MEKEITLVMTHRHQDGTRYRENEHDNDDQRE